MLQQNNNVEIGTEIYIATAESFYALASTDGRLFYSKIASQKKHFVLHCGRIFIVDVLLMELPTKRIEMYFRNTINSINKTKHLIASVHLTHSSLQLFAQEKNETNRTRKKQKNIIELSVADSSIHSFFISFTIVY